MKVAIVHYWFITRRGGEKVVESILKLFPDADIYTLFYDKSTYGNFLENNKVYTSILDKPFLRKHYQKIFPLYPLGIRSLKLKEDYDLIISSESGPAKGIKISNSAKHICYIHSPMRYCWTHTDLYVQSVNPLWRPLMRYFLKRLKMWDKKTVSNVDVYIANSNNVANRVKKFYNRESLVLYPPISDDLFSKPLSETNKKEIYLSFGALTPYKKIDLLIDVFNVIDRKLIIIGQGSEKKKLQQKANSNISFLEYSSWGQIEKVLCNTKALLFPGEEDFGMIPLEVMAYGIPVIAYKKGGALETVVENKTDISKSSGIFFDEQEKQPVINAINLFEEVENEFNSNWIKEYASKFSEKHFLSNFIQIVGKINKGNKV
ncbi:MAG: glycosyltransferase [Flavobacteriaceae bacterium]|jgi:glycosyltransferase involved in cell wall biosynthesis